MNIRYNYNLKFILKEPAAKETSLIYAKCSLGSTYFKISTGLTIKPTKWDKVHQKPKRGFVDEKYYNDVLDKVRQNFLQAINDLKNSNLEITKESVKEKYLDNLKVKKKVQKPDILKLLKLFMKEYRFNGRQLSPNTLKNYRKLYNKLDEFFIKINSKLTLEKLDKSNIEKFLDFLYSQNLTNNTVGAYIKDVKTFMKWAYENGHSENNYFTKIKKIQEDTEKFALSFDELKAIENLDLSQSQNLNFSRDMFLLNCYTGARYGDFIKLGKNSIFPNEGIIKFTSEKTKTPTVVPITPKIKSILDKYPDLNFNFFTSQHQSRNIKEICRLAGMTQEIKMTKGSGNKKIEIIKPKYMFVENHTARRTFITLSINLNIHSEMIQKAAGIKKSETFKKYIKLSEDMIKNAFEGKWQ